MFFIPVSSVSALAGRHRYKNKEEAWAEIITKYIPDVYKLLIDTYKSKLQQIDVIIEAFSEFKIDSNLTDEQNYDKAIKEPEIALFMEKKLNQPTKNEVNVEQQKITENSSIYTNFITSEQLSEENIKTTVSNIASETKLPENIINNIITKDRGTYLENTTIKKLKKDYYFNIIIESKMIKKMFSLDPLTKKHDYIIGGRVDGIVDGFINDTTNSQIYKKRIIEIKNRKNKFFIPDYDLDQLACYMILYGSEYQGQLIQQYNGDLVLDEIKTHDWAITRFAHIENELRINLQLMLDIINNPHSENTLNFVSEFLL